MESLFKTERKSFFLILGVLLISAGAGFLSRPCLGDEISFYRLARGFFESGKRLAIDPVYTKSHLIYFYNSEPLWPAVLGWLWKLLGKVSLTAAQLYQAVYFAGLLTATFLLSKRLSTNPSQPFLSILLLATTPMTAAFSVLFYVEIPMMFFLVMSAYFFIQRKTFPAALLICAAYLTKATALFFLPAFLWLILRDEKNWKDRIGRAVLFLTPVLTALFLDSLWRSRHLNINYLFPNIPQPVVQQSSWQALKDRLSLADARHRLTEYAQTGVWEYTSSSLLNILDIFKYFGLVMTGLGIYFLARKGYRQRRYETVFISCYLIFFVYICILSPDVRYLLPIVPFAAIAFSSVLAEIWSKKIIKTLAVILCVLQFTGAIGYVLKERRIPEAIQEGFSFIKRNVPEEALTIYPEYIFVEETNRGVVWAHRFRDPLRQLFWDANKAPVVDYLVTRNIRYLAVKKTRIYDDSKQHHFGGYPMSFVAELGHSRYFRKIFDNSKMSVWELQNAESTN